MKNIRIGKDITVRWPILTNAKPLPLAGRDLTLIIKSPDLSGESTLFECEANVAVFHIRGVSQLHVGAYSFTLFENYGKIGQTAVDYCEAFRLVSSTCKEDLVAPAGNLTVETVNLESSILELGVQGDKGLSAYEVEVKNGFIGTEAEWLKSLHADADKVAADLLLETKTRVAADQSFAAKQAEEERARVAADQALTTEVGKKATPQQITDAVAAEIAARVAADQELAAATEQKMNAKDAATLTAAKEFATAADTTTLRAAKEFTTSEIGKIPTPDVSGQIATHNSATTSHADIRKKIEILETAAPLKADLDSTDKTIVPEQIAPLQGLQTGVKSQNGGYYTTTNSQLLVRGNKTYEISFKSAISQTKNGYLMYMIYPSGFGQDNIEYYVGNNPYFSIRINNEPIKSIACIPDTLYHIVIAIDYTKGESLVCCNGISYTLSISKTTTNPKNFSLLALNNGASGLDATINKFRLFNSALSADECKSLFGSGDSNQMLSNSLRAKCVAEYIPCGLLSKKWRDTSGNGNDLPATGSMEMVYQSLDKLVETITVATATLNVVGGHTYLCGVMTSLTLATVENAPREAVIRFASGAAATTLSLPATLKVVGYAKPAANQSYEISIRQGAAVIVNF